MSKEGVFVTCRSVYMRYNTVICLFYRILGVLYSEGKVLKKNHKKAVIWLKKSVRRGDALDAGFISDIYMEIQDLEKALRWAEIAARMGAPGGYWCVGWLYEKNSKNNIVYLKEAFKYYLRGARNNEVRAVSAVAVCFEFGKGTYRDYDEAYDWYKFAVSMGDEFAQKGLDHVYKRLTKPTKWRSTPLGMKGRANYHLNKLRIDDKKRKIHTFEECFNFWFYEDIYAHGYNDRKYVVKDLVALLKLENTYELEKLRAQDIILYRNFLLYKRCLAHQTVRRRINSLRELFNYFLAKNNPVVWAEEYLQYSRKDKSILKARSLLCENPLIIDFEGRGEQAAYPVELAIIDVDGNVLFNSLIKPEMPFSGVTRNKITYEILKDAPSWQDIHDEVKQILDGRKILSYNSEFDERVLRRTALRNKCSKIKYNFGCIMKLYSKYHGEYKIERDSFTYISLDEALTTLRLPRPVQRHSALSDCFSALDILREIANSDLKFSS